MPTIYVIVYSTKFLRDKEFTATFGAQNFEKRKGTRKVIVEAGYRNMKHLSLVIFPPERSGHINTTINFLICIRWFFEGKGM